MLAGNPGPREAAYRAAGVTDFVFVGINAVDLLRSLLERLTRLSARIEDIDATLSAADLYARHPAQATALAKERAERAALLAAAEDEWLSLSAAYEEATAAD